MKIALIIFYAVASAYYGGMAYKSYLQLSDKTSGTHFDQDTGNEREK